MLTTAEADEYCRRNDRAMAMRHRAIDEYAAARCCVLSGLLLGLTLAAESVEKLLKAYALYVEPTFKPKSFSHQIAKLGNAVGALANPLDVSRFENLFVRLEGHFATRYPDNPNQPARQTSSELDEVDEFVFFIEDRMPLPDEVKFRSGLPMWLFIQVERGPGYVFPQGRWVRERNAAVDTFEPVWEPRFLEILRWRRGVVPGAGV